ncbi:MAG TPA: TetR/AcrR family transcriptional regulator [Candidatus Xenobia bacterium]|jgi:AcrR family transcriptional regulator
MSKVETAGTSVGSARERILATAGELFYREGIRAVGVDTIVRHSGVTKMTLYRHFASKDDLVVAYLERAILNFWSWFDKVMKQHPGSPRQQIEDYFEALGERVVEVQRGCAHLNVKAEFSDPSHPARVLVAHHKEHVRGKLRQLLTEAGARHPSRVADQLVVLVNGAHSSNQLYDDFDLSATLTDAAQALLAGAFE